MRASQVRRARLGWLMGFAGMGYLGFRATVFRAPRGWFAGIAGYRVTMGLASALGMSFRDLTP